MPPYGHRKRNRYRILPGNLLEIRLTQGRVTIIDGADSRVLEHTWHAVQVGQRWYARTMLGARRPYYLHWMILGRRSEVDHRDGDGLNNRRQNLRPATRQQNTQARMRLRRGKTSAYRGVCWDKSRRRWLAQFIHPDGRKSFKRFQDEIEAARWWDAHARAEYGDYAAPNFTVH